MSTDYKEHMLVQTFIDLDKQISSLTQRLNANRFIELGDDPRLVREIESALMRVYGKARSLEEHFDLNFTSLGKANLYFSLIKHVNDTIKFLREVRKRDYGSRQHTLEVLGKLDDCLKSLYVIGDLASPNTEIIH
jgi:hypothetical protein